MRETHMHNFYDEQFEDGSVGFTCQTCGYFYHFEPRVKPKVKSSLADTLVIDLYKLAVARELKDTQIMLLKDMEKEDGKAR